MHLKLKDTQPCIIDTQVGIWGHDKNVQDGYCTPELHRNKLSDINCYLKATSQLVTRSSRHTACHHTVNLSQASTYENHQS